MKKALKQYGFSADVVETFVLGRAIGSFLDCEGVRHDLNAQDLPLSQELSAKLCAAAARYCGTVVTRSAQASIVALKSFASFIASEDKNYTEVSQIDVRVRRRYLAFLRESIVTGRYSVSTQRGIFGKVDQIIRDAFAFEGLHFVRVQNAFPGSSKSDNPRAVLSPLDLRAVLGAAKRDVNECWEKFSQARTVEPTSKLGIALSFVNNELKGRLDRIAKPDRGPNYKWWKMIREAGGMENVAQHLHATILSLIPYLILLTYHTAGNIEAVAKARRECMHPDPLLNGTYTITWFKLRSNADQRVSRMDNHRFSAPVLIRQVLDMTAPILDKVSEAESDMLFLCFQNGNYGALRAWNDALKGFIKRHKLVDLNGAPLNINFAMFRPTVMNEVYLKTGSLAHVRKLANHKDPATTMKYLRERIIGGKLDATIARSQAKLFSQLSTIPNSAVKSIKRQRVGLLGRGVANDCLDVMDSPAAGDRNRKSCPAWLWPLNDPDLIVPDEARPVAYLLQIQTAIEKARGSMSPMRFAAVFDEFSETLKAIVSKVSRDTVDEAGWLAETLPPLPDLAAE